MKIYLNKTEVELPQGTTVAELIKIKGLDGPGIAVAVDNKVVRRDQRETTPLAEGANVVVITAVCGG